MLKHTSSLPVKASRLPPIESIERAIASAERLVVPLNSMCSMKCEMPLRSAISRREPVHTQMPTETDRTCGMRSLMTRSPFESVVISISRTGFAEVDISERSCSTFFVALFGAGR